MRDREGDDQLTTLGSPMVRSIVRKKKNPSSVTAQTRPFPLTFGLLEFQPHDPSILYGEITSITYTCSVWLNCTKEA